MPNSLKSNAYAYTSTLLCVGYMTLKGRTETVEGIDRKMCVNYYFRIRCAINLMPQLEEASKDNELARVGKHR